ncbi:P-loop containing nucleoside triphosphate hydrolase protein [Xylariaceae sp. FL0016]|nr:P-loop containing nucleoside triphosphate hydrolase protein [Xylariaceae sp. FL0016]
MANSTGKIGRRMSIHDLNDRELLMYTAEKTEIIEMALTKKCKDDVKERIDANLCQVTSSLELLTAAVKKSNATEFQEGVDKMAAIIRKHLTLIPDSNTTRPVIDLKESDAHKGHSQASGTVDSTIGTLQRDANALHDTVPVLGAEVGQFRKLLADYQTLYIEQRDFMKGEQAGLRASSRQQQDQEWTVVSPSSSDKSKDQTEAIQLLQEQLEKLTVENDHAQAQLSAIVEQEMDALAQLEFMQKSVNYWQNKARVVQEENWDLRGNIRVMCRIRPAPKEMSDDDFITFTRPEGSEIEWKAMDVHFVRNAATGRRAEVKSFEFERIFGEDADNGQIFEEVKDLVESAIHGRRVSVFSYGQTGSGKTFTFSAEDGLIARAIAMIFGASKGSDEVEIQVEMSAIEIYINQVFDLLAAAKEKTEARIDQATYLPVGEADEMYKFLDKANHLRETASTVMNATSSRSHLLVTFRINRRPLDDSQDPTTGLLTMVDLAGSERPAETGAEGTRFKEGTQINKSLSSLNLAIKNLGERKPIAYDTALVRALRPTLSQGCRTLMFVMVSPLKVNEANTLATLARGAEATKARLASLESRITAPGGGGGGRSAARRAMMPVRTSSTPSSSPGSRGSMATPSTPSTATRSSVSGAGSMGLFSGSRTRFTPSTPKAGSPKSGVVPKRDRIGGVR